MLTRSQIWNEIDRLDREIEEIQDYLDNDPCSCKEHECDDCDSVMYERGRLCEFKWERSWYVDMFPEVKYWNSKTDWLADRTKLVSQE